MQAVQKHGLRPNRIPHVPPHEGRCQLRCPVHRGVIEKQHLRCIKAYRISKELIATMPANYGQENSINRRLWQGCIKLAPVTPVPLSKKLQVDDVDVVIPVFIPFPASAGSVATAKA